MARAKKIIAGNQPTQIFGLLESNVQFYAKQFPCLLESAKGATVHDVDGNRYLDFLAGAGSLNYGHNNPYFKEQLIQYIEQDGIALSLDFHTSSKQRFLEALNDIILQPRELDYVVQFTGPTGTNAVEAALKLARKVTGRTNIVSFTNSFHGVTAGALSTTGSRFHRRAAGIPQFGSVTMPFDGYFGEEVDTIVYLERLLADPSSGVDEPAAVILETIQGEGGLRAASNSWLKRLEALCREREILLIVDDIQSGCGRTGKFFSFEESGIIPDIVTLSKSLSGFGLPFAVVLIRRELDIWEPGEHSGTFRGNNHAFVTATAALEKYWRDDTFVSEVRAKSVHLGMKLDRLAAEFTPHIMEVRGRGMMRGLVFREPDRAASVIAEAFDNGLIIELAGSLNEVIKFLMPLTIEFHELDEGLDILERCLSDQFRG